MRDVDVDWGGSPPRPPRIRISIGMGIVSEGAICKPHSCQQKKKYTAARCLRYNTLDLTTVRR